MKRFVLPLLVICLLVLVLPAAASAATPEEAVDQLVADDYTVGVIDSLTAMGTDPLLGFRLAGTWAEHDASYYVRDQLTAMGLSDVRLEAVPVDAWDFKGAWVKVGDETITASSFAGVPGTGGEIHGDLVYVGTGTRQEFDAAGEVAGKLVLVDIEMDDSWMNFVGAEATLRHAAGVIMTYGENTYPWYSYPDALGGNDGEYDDDWVSMVYVTWQDGDKLKEQLAAGPVEATMMNDVTITLAENGGVGYNVVGVLPGSDPNAEPVLMASHIDAHFRAGLDDTGAVANELLVARALVESGAQPRRSIIFFFTCAEEYGYTDCWYDWAIGAWYGITQEHPDWAGNIAMMINLELMAAPGYPVHVRGAAEVMPFVEGVAGESGDLTPYGVTAEYLPDTWNDQWSFNASGIPTVTVDTWAEEYDTFYHTNLETKDLVDHEYLGMVAKYNLRLIAGLDEGLLPYDLSARGDQVMSAIKPGKLIRAGAGRRAVTGFRNAATAFRFAAWKWEQRKAATPDNKIDAVNRELIALEKIINTTFTSRDSYDFTAYPHEQAVIDSIYLTQAITAARAGNVARAQQMITWWTGINWYLDLYSPQVCRDDLVRHDPDYEHVTWGAMGNPPLTVDCIDEWVALGEGDVDTAIAGLEADRDAVKADLARRVADMTKALQKLTTRVDALP